MRTASAPYPRYRWAAALMLAVVVLSAAVTIKHDAAANLAPPAAQASRANALLRPAAVVNDSSSRAAQASRARSVAAYGKLPLSFEINQGQTDPRVKFLSRGSGYSLFLTGNEAVLELHKGTPPSKFGSESAGQRSPINQLQPATFIAGRAKQHSPKTMDVLRMRLVGANARATVTGLEELPARSNYFIGNDPRKWRTNVPNYARVKYANVYPGVDLVYYGASVCDVCNGFIKVAEGDGSFRYYERFVVGSGPTALAAGDLDGDGSLDLAVPLNAGAVSVLLNKPTIALFPNKLSFSPQRIGTTSGSQTILLSNPSAASLTITAISVAGGNHLDFKRGNCPATIPPASNCALSVTFTPTAAGTRSASVIIRDNSLAGAQGVVLEGVGTTQ